MSEQFLNVKSVSFLGSELIAAQDVDGEIWAAVRWVCNGIGLNENQARRERKRIQRDIALSDGWRYLPLPTDGGVQDVLCLRLAYVPLWLAKINITPNMLRTMPDSVNTLLQYQRQVRDAFADAFVGTGSDSSGLPSRMTDREVCEMLAKCKASSLEYLVGYLTQCGYYVPVDDSGDSHSESDEILLKFVADVMSQCVWDLLPFGFLYDLYKSWFNRSKFGSDVKMLGRNTFIRCLYDLCECGQVPDWTCPGRQTPIRPKNLMSGYERLVDVYHVGAHWNHSRKLSYNGLLRVIPSIERDT